MNGKNNDVNKRAGSQLSRRAFLKTTLMLGGVSALAACVAPAAAPAANEPAKEAAPQAAAPAEQVSLRLWTLNFDPFIIPIGKFADAFTAANGKVKVSVEGTADIFDKFPAAVNAGTAGDILFMSRSMFEFFVAKKFLPLPEEIMSFVDWQKTFHPASQGIWMWENRPYGYNSDFNVEGYTLLQINKTLLKQYNKEVPQAWVDKGEPPSWQEMLDFAKSITIKKSGKVAVPGLVGAASYWQYARLFSLIWQQGGDYRDFDKKVVKFNTTEGNAAMNFLYKWLKQDEVENLDLGDSIDVFITQKNAFMAACAPHWGQKTLLEQKDMDWTMLKLPAAFGTKRPFPVEGGWGYAVPSATKHPKEAWDFASFAGNYNNQKTIQLESAMLPTRNDAFKDADYVKDPYGRWNKPMFDIITEGQPVAWYIMNQTEFDDLVKTHIDKIYHDELKVSEGLKAMEDAVNAMIVKKWEPYGGVPQARK